MGSAGSLSLADSFLEEAVPASQVHNACVVMMTLTTRARNEGCCLSYLWARGMSNMLGKTNGKKEEALER